MFFTQLYDRSLAQASYLIGCQATGDAIVIDPLRDVRPYLAVAEREGLRITHVTETHIHADFVSGARELAAATGARLHLSGEGGADWQYAFAASDGAALLHDGDVLMVGNIKLEVLHTPGHTPEHLSFVVTDTPAASGPMGILTGDFVFVGDVGRPDLLEKAAKVANTMEAGARTLFRSLQRFRALPDHLQVWPGHGAGSACGKALGAVPSSTVGYEKRANWGMKRINRDGPVVLGTLPMPARADADALPALVRDRAWLIDLRPAAEFAAGHVPGALSLPLNRSFATWAGSLLPYDAPLHLITGARGADAVTQITTAVHELTHIGLDRVVSWFDADALDQWRQDGREWQDVPMLGAHDLASRQLRESLQVLDVRGASEFGAGHLPGVANIPLGDLPTVAASLDALTPIVVQCQSGARSMIAASVLQRAGRHDVFNLIGGFVAWRDAGLPVDRSPRESA
ncbi:MAG: MBL fold metallo-hydrolase [Gemmatimonadaceae bacterium]|nr:MBL fold metallo-hydrolase [Gemmatimonadaceae bacterium]